MCGEFYQTNIEVLKWDPINDIIKIQFNHYISRKENLERLNKNLPRGSFKITVRTAAQDLDITEKITRGLLELFTQLGIITRVDKNPKGSKLPSIYTYNSTVENAVLKGTEEDTEKDTEEDTEEASKFNGLRVIKGTEEDTEKDTEKGTSKKELLNKVIKKDNMCSNEEVENIWKLYPKKKGKADAVKKIPKLIKEYGYEQVVRTVERYKKYIQDENTDMKYVKQGDTFFNSGYVDYLDANLNDVMAKEIQSGFINDKYSKYKTY